MLDVVNVVAAVGSYCVAMAVVLVKDCHRFPAGNAPLCSLRSCLSRAAVVAIVLCHLEGWLGLLTARSDCGVCMWLLE